MNGPVGTVQKKSFRLLCFGNSFTEDSMGYVPMILQQIAPDADVTIGIAYIGGCSLEQHLANFRGETYIYDGKEYSPTTYKLYKSEHNGAWTTRRNMSVDAILASDEWDIVTFQQNGSKAYCEWSEVIWPHLSELVKLLDEKVKVPVRLGWILTHGAYGASDAGFEEYWRGTADNARKTAETFDCVVFPYGTAVQNMRTTGLRVLGDGSANNLTIDNGHLQEGIGCYGASLTNALMILQQAGVDVADISDDNPIITEAAIRGMNVPGQHFGSGIIGMTPENMAIARQAAIAAISNPYTLTDLTTTPAL